MGRTASIQSVAKLARPTVEHQATAEHTDISIHHCRTSTTYERKGISLSVLELNQVVLNKEASYARILHKM